MEEGQIGEVKNDTTQSFSREPKDKRLFLFLGAGLIVLILIILIIIKLVLNHGGLPHTYQDQPAAPSENDNVSLNDLEKSTEEQYSTVSEQVKQMLADDSAAAMEYLDTEIDRRAAAGEQELWFRLWLLRVQKTCLDLNDPETALKYLDFIKVDDLTAPQRYLLYSNYYMVSSDLGDEAAAEKYTNLMIEVQRSGQLLEDEVENAKEDK